MTSNAATSCRHVQSGGGKKGKKSRGPSAREQRYLARKAEEEVNAAAAKTKAKTTKKNKNQNKKKKR